MRDPDDTPSDMDIFDVLGTREPYLIVTAYHDLTLRSIFMVVTRDGL